MDKLKVTPTSRRTAEVEDIVLRSLERVRLVFRPVLVDNYRLEDACIRGHFVYQKKRKRDNWVDVDALSLSKLRSKEWIKLELHSSELLSLVAELNALYDLYREQGIPRRPTEYVSLDSHVQALLESNEEELASFLEGNPDAGVSVVSRVLRWVAGLDDVSHVVDGLERLDLSHLNRLSSLAGLGALEASLDTWRKNSDKDDEDFWHRTFAANSLILSQMFAYPVIVIRGKAYVGGKSIENTGGGLVDFLARNDLTKNAVLIEIKSPTARLLGGEYRGGVYPMSAELSGAISQVCNYRYSLMIEYFELSGKSHEEFRAFDPECVIIAGNLGNELETDDKVRSFDLLRAQLARTQVVTYDELFGKVELLLETLKGEFNRPDMNV